MVQFKTNQNGPWELFHNSRTSNEIPNTDFQFRNLITILFFLSEWNVLTLHLTVKNKYANIFVIHSVIITIVIALSTEYFLQKYMKFVI